MNLREVMDRRQAAAFSLRVLLGYPRHKPVCDTLAFAFSGSSDLATELQLARAVVDMGRDMVVLHYDMHTEALVSITLLVRRADVVDILRDCAVYTASHDAPLQLIAGDALWRLDARLTLTPHRLPPARRIARGRALAERRWREAAEAAGPLRLSGSRFLPKGATLATSLDAEALIDALAA